MSDTLVAAHLDNAHESLRKAWEAAADDEALQGSLELSLAGVDWLRETVGLTRAPAPASA